ncbi:MmcQ/YjbR family DNA-binding protein [Aurantivibrio infirmus]
MSKVSAHSVNKIRKFCLTFAGVEEKQVGDPANILSYSVGAKKFAYFKTSDPEKWRFSFRVTPERFLELTDQSDIKPARYMHRFHWVSVVNLNSISDAYLKELITWSYEKARRSLPNKIQTQILNEINSN